MYLRIPLLLQNKLLIWRPLGYCELSVPSFNMLFSLLTAADFLYHQFWEFDSWSRQSLPFHDNYVIFNTLLLGNLLKEVKINNMLITLELKKMSASFQNLPTLPPQKHTKFSTPSFTQCLSNVLWNTAAEIFSGYSILIISSLLLLLILFCNSYSTLQVVECLYWRN